MYLSIDLGDKKCGIALEIENIVVPKAIVPRVQLIQYIKKLMRDYTLTHIIVGLPYDLYGKDKKQLEKTYTFIEKLKNIFPDICIDAIDERFTTFEAENIMTKIGMSGKTNNKDDISAVLILESYLRKKKKEN